MCNMQHPGGMYMDLGWNAILPSSSSSSKKITRRTPRRHTALEHALVPCTNAILTTSISIMHTTPSSSLILICRALAWRSLPLALSCFNRSNLFRHYILPFCSCTFFQAPPLFSSRTNFMAATGSSVPQCAITLGSFGRQGTMLPCRCKRIFRKQRNPTL
jgi:hypothetical protein